MNEYKLQSRSLPLNSGWDVIVLGGGPAGCTAAAAAAREGAKTLIIEATGCLGGMGTSGLVPAWCPFSDKETIIYRGLAQKVFEAVKAGMPGVDSKALDWVPIDPELLKRVYDEMLAEAGAAVLFNTSLAAVDMDREKPGAVNAVIVCNKNGLTAYRGKVYIDCTGDADAAAWAGAKFHTGDDDTGEMQPATHCFTLANVDEGEYKAGPWLHPNNPDSPIYDIVASGKYSDIPDFHLCNNLIGPGVVGFNAGHIWGVDNTKPETVSEALVKGRKMAAAFLAALKEYHPKAFANAFLVNTGSLMGIRETRRIVGDYELTVEDYLERRSFEDEICRNSYYIDVHGSEKEAKSRERGLRSLESKRLSYGKGESHGIPYRCLVPKDIRNIIVAGRSISCDRRIQGSVRVMPVCLAMGEAAGIAGAMASQSEAVDVHGVDVAILRKRIKELGGYIK